MHSFAHMHLQTIPRNGIGESKDTRTDDFVRSCQLPLQRAESIFFAPSTIEESPQIFWEEVFLEYQPAPYPRLPCLYSWPIGMTQKASVCTPQVFHKSHGQNQIPKFLGIRLHILSFTFFFGKKKNKEKANDICSLEVSLGNMEKKYKGNLLLFHTQQVPIWFVQRALVRLSIHLINK